MERAVANILTSDDIDRDSTEILDTLKKEHDELKGFWLELPHQTGQAAGW